MKEPEIIEKIRKELATAQESQARGNQGRARVCARRAAGWAAQEYLIRQGDSADSPSALDQLKYLAERDGFPPRIYEALHRLTVKMEKDNLDDEAYYPIAGVNLIDEAHWLAEELLQTKIPLSGNSSQ